jgi:hypothetical protein
MRRIVLTLCIFFAFITSIYAEEIYNCIDRNGNAIITDIPQDGMENCVLKDSYRKKAPDEPANAKEKANVKAKETPKASETRIKNCINCCNNKVPACYNFTADSRLCSAENQNCVATCNSEGSSPSSWSDCWSQSGK